MEIFAYLFVCFTWLSPIGQNMLQNVHSFKYEPSCIEIFSNMVADSYCLCTRWTLRNRTAYSDRIVTYFLERNRARTIVPQFQTSRVEITWVLHPPVWFRRSTTVIAISAVLDYCSHISGYMLTQWRLCSQGCYGFAHHHLRNVTYYITQNILGLRIQYKVLGNTSLKRIIAFPYWYYSKGDSYAKFCAIFGAVGSL